MNTEQERALLPCPFCGGKAHFSRSEDLVNVRCEGWNPGKCLGAGPNCYTETDAAAGWNRRAALQSQHDEETKNLRDALWVAERKLEALQSQDREVVVPYEVVVNVANKLLGAEQYERFMGELDHARRVEGDGE